MAFLVVWSIICFLSGYYIDDYLREKYQQQDIEGEFGEPTIIELIIYDIWYKIKGILYRQPIEKDPYIKSRFQ